MASDALLRIGELSRRSGVSPELLRAWERRYDLLRPTRSPGGLRLYTAHDLERVEAMRRHLAAGLAAAEAAALAGRAETGAADESPSPDAARVELGAALAAFDEAAAHVVVDALLARIPLEPAVRTGGDAGAPITSTQHPSSDTSVAAAALRELARTVAGRISVIAEPFAGARAS